MRPFSGVSSLLRRRNIVDFPEPEVPTRKTNSPFWMSALASRRATTSPLYTFVTFSSLIMGRQGQGVARREAGCSASARFGRSGYQWPSDGWEHPSPAVHRQLPWSASSTGNFGASGTWADQQE